MYLLTGAYWNPADAVLVSRLTSGGLLHSYTTVNDSGGIGSRSTENHQDDRSNEPFWIGGDFLGSHHANTNSSFGIFCEYLILEDCEVDPDYFLLGSL